MKLYKRPEVLSIFKYSDYHHAITCGILHDRVVRCWIIYLCGVLLQLHENMFQVARDLVPGAEIKVDEIKTTLKHIRHKGDSIKVHVK